LALRISEHPNATYVLALPEDKYYRNIVAKTLTAIRKLGVVVYFLNKDDVEIIS